MLPIYQYSRMLSLSGLHLGLLTSPCNRRAVRSAVAVRRRVTSRVLVRAAEDGLLALGRKLMQLPPTVLRSRLPGPREVPVVHRRMLHKQLPFPLLRLHLLPQVQRVVQRLLLNQMVMLMLVPVPVPVRFFLDLGPGDGQRSMLMKLLLPAEAGDVDEAVAVAVEGEEEDAAEDTC